MYGHLLTLHSKSKRFIAWAGKNFDLPILEEFIHAIRELILCSLQLCLNSLTTKLATAELEPITENYVQSDEGN